MQNLALPDLRRQILEDVLGDSVEEYENFNKEEAESKRQHRQRIPLWQFLLHLLNRDTNERYIQWSKEYELEFRIKDTVGVAELWGSVKNKTDMTYEKLGRAMRYYYGKSIIEKVTGRRYSYRFILSRRTKKYLSQFINVTQMTIQPASESDHEINEDNAMSPRMTDENNNKRRKTVSVSSPPPRERTPKDYRTEYSRSPSSQLSCPTAITKTKIFRPDESLSRYFATADPSIPQEKVTKAEKISTPLKIRDTRNSIIYHDSTQRRSAFFVPEKSVGIIRENAPSLIQALQTMPLSPVSSETQVTRSPTYQENRKRSYPFPAKSTIREKNAIAYCCCGSHNCKIKYVDYASEESECESSYSRESISPIAVMEKPKKTTLSMMNSRTNYIDSYGLHDFHEESIRKELRELKDYREREKNEIMIMKQSLGGSKLDPFMGYKDAGPLMDDFLLNDMTQFDQRHF
ncbi:ETS domain-containing protein Elk-4-like [Clytia hemisphaerica]|uniref:ETS domain-containing protein n=1 Tax=Clytia hemisphaerica TaxID=252671 RepID=A0A7M5WXY2_9CNID